MRSIAVDSSGHYMATSGLDGQVHIYDVRTYNKLHSYFTHHPPTSMNISQTGLLSIASGNKVQIWKDAISTKSKFPYMIHSLPGEEVSLY